MRAVLDASVVVRAVPPHLLPFEVATAIRRLEAGGQISTEHAEVALIGALRLRVTLRTPRDLRIRSLNLALETP